MLIRSGLLALSAALALATPVVADTGDAEAGRRKAASCAACHGEGGNSTRPEVPSLAGQPSLYTYYQLIQFSQGRRSDPEMAPLAAALSDADMLDLAAYFATQRPGPAPASSRPTDPAKVAAGQRLSAAHYCASCHAPGFVGQKHIPRLTGLSYEYLVKQLQGFKAQTRADTDGFMTIAAQPLSAEDIESLAQYITSVRPAP